LEQHNHTDTHQVLQSQVQLGDIVQLKMDIANVPEKLDMVQMVDIHTELQAEQLAVTTELSEIL
jgi:hypothetical protein